MLTPEQEKEERGCDERYLIAGKREREIELEKRAYREGE